MRKINGILTALILALFLAHGIMGAYQLFGAGSTALKTLAWIAVGLTAVHAAIGVIYTVRTLRVSRKTGVSYTRENRLFWARRISGFALLVLMAFHMTAFSAGGDVGYRLKWFTAGRLVTQILFVLTLAVHLIANIRPMLISFGIRGLKKRAFDILFVLSVVLVFMAASLIVYYIRWNRLG